MRIDKTFEDIKLLYSTLPNMEDAKKIASLAVEKKLCVCVNIFPAINSIYQWQGKIEESNEVVVIFKTIKDKQTDLTNFIKENHPYEVPAILSICASGNQEFIDWMLGSLT